MRSDRVVGRGVLLDIARSRGVAWLEPGDQIHAEDLEACARSQGVSVGRGDIVLIRTGQMAQCRAAGELGRLRGWGRSRTRPGRRSLDLRSRTGGGRQDTWGLEVLPNQTADVFQPLHIILIVSHGPADRRDLRPRGPRRGLCGDGVYEFLFTAPPLPITGAVGSPVNPLAVK